MKQISGCILTSQGWIDGIVEFDDIILNIAGKPVQEPSPPYILPGFIDLHVHGGQGVDSMQGDVAITQMATLHAQHGTTSLLPTSVTASAGDIESFLQAAKRCISTMHEQPHLHARLLGVHLEGPFINPQKLGAQPDEVMVASADSKNLIRQWLSIVPVRVVTLAPEGNGMAKVIEMFQKAGCKVQLGHSLCNYAEAAQAISCGCGITHLFNAMSGIAHRGNGLAGAALAHSDYAEIIPDLCHVEEGAILAAKRAIPYLYGVTDATAGAGMPDGQYTLGSHIVTKVDGVMRLPDGTLAGSALTMDKAFKNFVSIGLSIQEASNRLSLYPADWIGEKSLGRLKEDGHSDIVIFDENIDLQIVFVAGNEITRTQ